MEWLVSVVATEAKCTFREAWRELGYKPVPGSWRTILDLRLMAEIHRRYDADDEVKRSNPSHYSAVSIARDYPEAFEQYIMAASGFFEDDD